MNRSFNKLHRKSFRAAVCALREGEEPVQSGLAYTPSQMFQMAQEGIPVSTQSVALKGSFDEGYRDLDFEPPLQYQRHVDLAELWEKSMDARTKISGVVKEARKKYQKGDK